MECNIFSLHEILRTRVMFPYEALLEDYMSVYPTAEKIFICLFFSFFFTIGIHDLILQNYACLPARTTTDRPMCKLQSDCHNPNIETSCVYPSIDNQTKLLRVIHGHKPPLLFLGHPLDLHYAGGYHLVTL